MTFGARTVNLKANTCPSVKQEETGVVIRHGDEIVVADEKIKEDVAAFILVHILLKEEKTEKPLCQYHLYVYSRNIFTLSIKYEEGAA